LGLSENSLPPQVPQAGYWL